MVMKDMAIAVIFFVSEYAIRYSWVQLVLKCAFLFNKAKSIDWTLNFLIFE